MPADGLNPYLKLYYGALSPYGVRLVDDFRPENAWLRAHHQTLDALHVQWYPEQLWRYYTGARIRNLRGIVGLWTFLSHLRQYGIRILWTVHDLEYHEESNAVDALGYRLLARYADLRICHSDWCRREVIRRYGAHVDTLAIPIGNYDGVFPPPADKDETLRALNLTAARKTLICFGHVRPYKGIEVALDAVRCLGPEYQLIVAGPALRPEWAASLERKANGMQNVRLILRRLDDPTLANLIHASDCVLLPYLKITGSASLVTALTLRRGVVATALPYFQEVLAPEPEAGVLCEVGDAAALARGVEAFCALPLEVRNTAARRLADRYNWTHVIAPVADWLIRRFTHPHPNWAVNAGSSDTRQKRANAGPGQLTDPAVRPEN